ncbi:MAG: hypothetical protein GX769_02465 [Erysipelothrix sp.]|nr:hypothetical protein [Erysipelothrix sp.]
MKKTKESSWLWYSIVLSLAVLAFIIFKEVLFLMFGALAAVLILVFTK